MSSRNSHNQQISVRKKNITEREKTKVKDILKELFTCVICLDIYKEPVGLFCGHLFCTRCITRWLTEHHNCPMCRLFISLRTRTNLERYQFIESIIKQMEESISPSSQISPSVQNRRAVSVSNTNVATLRHVDTERQVHTERRRSLAPLALSTPISTNNRRISNSISNRPPWR